MKDFISVLEENKTILNEGIVPSMDLSSTKFKKEMEEEVIDPFVLQESYIVGDIKDLEEIIKFGKYTLYGSDSFNNKILNKLIENSRTMNMFGDEIKNAFNVSKDCYFTVFNKSKMGYILSKLKNKVIDFFTYLPEHHILGFYIPDENKLFIVLNNSSSVLSNVDDEKITEIIIHELSHKFAKERVNENKRINLNLMKAFYKEFLSNISVEAYLKVLETSLEKNPNLSYSDDTPNEMLKFIKYDSGVSKAIDDLTDSLIRLEGNVSTSEQMWKRKLRRIIGEWNKVLDSMESSFDKNKSKFGMTSNEIKDMFRDYARRYCIIPLEMYLFQSTDKLVDYILYTEYGRSMYFSFIKTYSDGIPRELNYMKPNKKKLTSLFIQELFVPSEIVAISNEIYVNNRTKEIKDMLKHF
ncbi:MAG: hypothetical protein WDA59_06875 [Methanofastidiosum sp.]